MVRLPLLVSWAEGSRLSHPQGSELIDHLPSAGDIRWSLVKMNRIETENLNFCIKLPWIFTQARVGVPDLIRGPGIEQEAESHQGFPFFLQILTCGHHCGCENYFCKGK